MLHPFSRSSTKLRIMLLGLAALQLAACSSSAQRAQNYYEQGAKLLAQHDYLRAEIEFKNAVRLKKDLLPAWRGLAQVEETKHNLRTLVPILQTIVDLNPKDTETKLKLAKMLLVAGASDDAAKLVSAIDDGSNSNPNLLALKALIAYRKQDRPAAVSQAQAALAIDQHNVDAMMVLAADRLENGDPKQALNILERNSGEHADELGVQLFKIKIFEQLHDLPEVEALLKRLIEFYPEELAFRRQLVSFYVGQHQLDDAESQLRAIVAADPANAEAELDLVRFLYRFRNPKQARQELLTRIGGSGDVFQYQMVLADLDFVEGNVAQSLSALKTLASNSGSPDHVLAAKIRLAELDLSVKNFDDADTIVADILHGDNRNTNALRLRAVIHLDRGEVEPAISDLREALNDQPRSQELMLLLASAYERNGAIELAEREFADAMKASSFDPAVGLDYVAFLRRHGRNDRAEDVLGDLASRRPNNVAILTTLAEIKLSHQDWASAQQISDSIRRLGNSDAIANQILGAAFNGQHKYDESIAAFQAAVAAAPSAVRPMASLVATMVQAKQNDKAIAFLQSALKNSPDNAEALVLLGSLRLTANAPDQAIKNFKTAIEKDPKSVLGYRALAGLYLQQKNYDDAVGVVQSGLKEQPNSVDLHMIWAGILENKGDYEGAISQYEQVLNAQPGFAVAANNLASLLSDHRADKTSLERAHALAVGLRETQVPQFKDTLGWVDFRQGDLKSAMPLLEQAGESLPDVALVHYHLGMGYMATGQYARASDQFKLALNKSPSKDLADMIQVEMKKAVAQ